MPILTLDQTCMPGQILFGLTCSLPGCGALHLGLVNVAHMCTVPQLLCLTTEPSLQPWLLRYVMDDVTQDSLVLVDELGKGTEVRAGAAIAGAMLERLDSIGCRGIFAT